MDTQLLDVDTSIADRFGELRAELLDRGLPRPTADLFIAATALVHDMTLVTHNTADYKNVPSLKLVDWLSP